MKIGIPAIKKSGYGMLEKHMEAISEVAGASGHLIAFRPVSKLAEYPLEHDFPTKELTIKPKTALNGIAASCIPVNAKFGRSVTSIEFKKHNELIAEAIKKDPNLQESPLILTKNRILELNDILQHQLCIIEDTAHALHISWDKQRLDGSTQKILVTAVPLKDEKYQIIDDETQQPVLVLAINGEPIASDYDLLLIGIKFKDIDLRKDKIAPIRTQCYTLSDGTSSTVAPLQISPTAEKSKALLASLPPTLLSPTKGNLSHDTEKLIFELNQAINHISGGRRFNTVNHGDEFHNPWACNIKDDLPAVIFLPEEVDLSSLDENHLQDLTKVKTLLIETAEELHQLHNVLRDKYYINTHKEHTKIIEPFKEEAVNATKHAAELILERLKKEKKNRLTERHIPSPSPFFSKNQKDLAPRKNKTIGGSHTPCAVSNIGLYSRKNSGPQADSPPWSHQFQRPPIA